MSKYGPEKTPYLGTFHTVNFQDCLNPIGLKFTHFFLHSPNCHWTRHNLFEKVNKIDLAILKQNYQVITKLLLFGNEILETVQNKSHINVYNSAPQAAERFKTSLFDIKSLSGNL